MRHYLCGWGTFDLITCFPSDWIYLGVTMASGIAPNVNILIALRALRLGRTLRLLTHRRVFTYLWHVFARLKIRAAYVTILKRTMVTIVFAHCNACLQFLISVLEGLPADCWVVRAGIHSTPSHPVSIETQYLASIFHAVSQMLAVGYGVVLPERDSEYITFVISLVLGANLYAVFVGTLISVIEDANGSHREYCKRTDMLQTWMTQRQLPRDLRRKLETYYEILFPGGHAFDDVQILSSLSAPLIEEVSRHKCARLLQQLEIDWATAPGLARRLSLLLERQVFVGGNIILYEGQRAAGMYFISAGCAMIHRGHTFIKKLSASNGIYSLFGEMALLSDEGRANATVSVPHHAYCDTSMLRAENFADLVFAYPSFRERLVRLRDQRERDDGERKHDADDSESMQTRRRDRAMRASAEAPDPAELSCPRHDLSTSSPARASGSPTFMRPATLGRQPTAADLMGGSTGGCAPPSLNA